MNYTTEPDAAYIAGRIFGIVLFPFLIYGVAYLIIRLTKKRKPTRKETKDIIIIAIVVTVVGVIGQAVMRVGENY